MGRIRDVRQGADGYIYAAIEDCAGGPTAIVRIEPVESLWSISSPAIYLTCLISSCHSKLDYSPGFHS